MRMPTKNEQNPRPLSLQAGHDADKAQLDRLTPEGAGASLGALNAAKRIMLLDGLALVRQSCRGPNSGSFDVAAFTAEFARIIDREMTVNDC